MAPAPWPYESYEDPDDHPEPSWECPEGICECGEHSETSRCEFSVMLCDPHGAKMPGARYRALVHGIVVNDDTPYADDQGWALVTVRRPPETITIEWAPADTPVVSPYPYRKIYFVELREDVREEAGLRRLLNLGFASGHSLRELVEQFQHHYDYTAITGRLEDIEPELRTYHDGACLPVVREDHVPAQSESKGFVEAEPEPARAAAPRGAQGTALHPESQPGGRPTPRHPPSPPPAPPTGAGHPRIGGGVPPGQGTARPSAAAPPPATQRLGKYVMIVPRAPVRLRENSRPQVFQQNWAYAQQWRQEDPTRREVITLPLYISTIAHFEAAVVRAAGLARRRDIILFIGHGAAQGCRNAQITAFDTVPEAGPLSQHRHSITADVLALPTMAEKQPDGRWRPRPYYRPGSSTATTESQATIDRLSPRYDALVRIGAALRRNGVGRFVVLSCNAGGDVEFGWSLCRTLDRKPVALYRWLVAVAEVDFYDVHPLPQGGARTVWRETKEQIWMEDPRSYNQQLHRPPQDDPDHDSFHEIPTAQQVNYPYGF